jgi:hypothetical protein
MQGTLRFVCIEICTGGRSGLAEIVSTKGYDIKGGNLTKARDMLIKQARAKHREDNRPVPGEDEPASQLIYKFSLGKQLVGYHHYEDGLTFLFNEGNPIYELIAAGKSPKDLAEKLVDLYDFHAGLSG